MNSNTLIPELRFPEFNDHHVWESEVLGQLSEIVRGGSPRPIQDFLTSDKDGLNWLKIADVPSDSKYISATKEKVKKEALKSSREVRSGDLILSNSMSFGRPYILKITTCIHDGWIAIRKISDKTFEDYLYYFMLSETSQKYFKTYAAGAAVKNLNADIIKSLPIYFPRESKEQQKIAACLSSLDEVIEAHNRKLELLNDHKNGLLQNLFPQNGETKPRYRFHEFENDEDWKSKKLGDKEVAFFVNEKVTISELTLDSYISTENMLSGFMGVSNASKLPSTGNLTKFKCGDILISNIRPYLKKVWKADITGGASNDVLVFRSGNDVSSDFLEFILKNDIFINYVMKSAKGVKMPRGDKNSMMNYTVYIPSKEEQQKIASCLSTLDLLITAQKEKIDQLRLHKKGLMQSLFPKMND